MNYHDLRIEELSLLLVAISGMFLSLILIIVFLLLHSVFTNKNFYQGTYTSFFLLSFFSACGLFDQTLNHEPGSLLLVCSVVFLMATTFGFYILFKHKKRKAIVFIKD